jgi:3-isopropylmalate/(R)-2-methylmalate dehydratase small subunit
MTPFTQIESLVVPLVRDNIDTDAIIPSREIRSVSKTGLADGLFAGWRYIGATRDPNPDFVLNQPQYAGANILAGGANFGCGSSREQAVWALLEYGFRVILAPSFNPIFRRNCVRNGILPIVCDAGEIAAAKGPALVDLANRSITTKDRQWAFSIDEETAIMLLHGLDEIELTLRKGQEIAAFRNADRHGRPWAYLHAS